MAQPPLIILGMHRSGTSVLARLLQTLGLFTGYSRERNHESIFFLRLNEWMLSETNASWDNPYCFRFLNDFLRTRIVSLMDRTLAGEGRVEFLGPDYAGKCVDIRELDVPWGWKDPRNSFTLEVWKVLFPDARILHIHRNPVDVAASLRRREIRRQQTIDRMISEQGIEGLLRRGMKIQTSVRVQNLGEGVRLWQEYLEQIDRLSQQFPGRCLHIKYEDLLADAGGVLHQATEFAGLSPNEEQYYMAGQMLDSRRRYAFVDDPDLVALYKSLREDFMVRKFGYDNIAVT